MESEQNGEFRPSEVIFGKSQLIKKLEELPCWAECISLIETGHRATAIARFIQVEKKECLDLTPDALRMGIQRWIQKEGHRFFDDQSAPTMSNMVESLDLKRDPLDVAYALLNVHFDRIMIDHKHEKRIGKCISQNTPAIKVAADILRTIALMDPRISGPKGDSEKMPATGFDPFDRKNEEIMRPYFEKKYGPRTEKFASNPRMRRLLLNAIESLNVLDKLPQETRDRLRAEEKTGS